MAKYKHYDYGQAKMLPVRFEEQILPGTFEYTLNRLIDERFNLEVFDAHYKNDETGAPAYDPAILLKIILYAYARGVTSSREIERLCRENVVFMALSADSRPHFTTIAAFIARLGDPIVSVFRDVLLVCDEMGLVGREMFAVDGVKLPSNAAKEWSGTKADFGKKIEKMERAVEHLVKRHREADERGEQSPAQQSRAKQIDTLEAALTKVRGFLRCHEDKVGASGRVKKSNITDPESAKMKTSKGVIQGYTGVAVVDGKHQIVVGAEAFGEGQEHGLLVPMLEQHARGVSRARSPRRCARRHSRECRCGFPHRAQSQTSGGNRRRCVCRRYPIQEARSALCNGRAAQAFARTRSGSVVRARGLPLRRGSAPLHLSSGQAALRQRLECGDPRLARNEVLRGQTRLRPLPFTRALPEESRTHAGPPSRLLPRTGDGKARVGKCPHEAQDRHRPGTLPVRPATRDGGTGVRQHLQCPPPAPVQPQEQEEGERAVAPLLHGAQHRQAAALRGRKNTMKPKADRAKMAKRARTGRT